MRIPSPMVVASCSMLLGVVGLTRVQVGGSAVVLSCVAGRKTLVLPSCLVLL